MNSTATLAGISPSTEPVTPTPPAPARTIVPRPTLLIRLTNLFAVLFPFAGLGVAIGLLWGVGFSWVHLGLLIGMYLVTGFGVTVGFHRLFTHKSFETRAWVRATLGILGSMAMEGPLFRWVAQHRMHHQYSDDPSDPHSPHGHGDGILGMLKGMWHAHIGWVFLPDKPDLNRYVADLKKDGVLRVVSGLFPLWVVLGMAIPALLGGLITMSWMGALLGFIWGGLARIFLIHHVTWSINSVCHMWGTRPFDCHDESRNNFIFGVLGFGEGWHNNHHAFPTSARHGLKWWQVDVSYGLIRVMQLVGLATRVRIPAPDAIAAKRH